MLIGNDAEFILVNGKGNPVSAIGLVGGTKLSPLPVEKGALQEDNVLAEINIHPAANSDEWEDNINSVIHSLNYKLPEGVLISSLASAFYDEENLSHHKAKEFGCDPDFNAWSGKINKPPKLKGKYLALRSAGGHIHVGLDKQMNSVEKATLIQYLDSTVGLQSLFLDKDKLRKRLYGKAGAMRLKDYGVEWRTPSNFWIFNKENRKWIFDAVTAATELYLSKEPKVVFPEIEKVINTSNKKRALMLLKSLKSNYNFPIHSEIVL